MANWAKQQGFDALDLGSAVPGDIKTLQAAGVQVGTVDLLEMGSILSADAGKRKELQARNLKHIADLSAAGVKYFFTVVIPGDGAMKRSDAYKLAVETFAPLCAAAKSAGGAVVIEGYPGGYPYFPALCCTPETLRPFLKEAPGSAINYDPSHLIRLGVDHVRFCQEFAPHIKHVHAKDTELFDENAYELGRLQPATFMKGHGFGECTWRYAIPGHGQARWTEIFRTLKSAGFGGVVSIELEDENFNTGEAGEKAGLTASLSFLRHA